MQINNTPDPNTEAGTNPASTARQVSASGYGEAGASWKKRALKGFIADSSSRRADIDHNNSTIKAAGSYALHGRPGGYLGLSDNRTNVIGCGLQFKARLDADTLGLSREAPTHGRNAPRQSSSSGHQEAGLRATGVNDFYSLKQLALMSWLLSGDVFVLFKRRDPTRLHPYSLRLQLIEADRIRTPRSRRHITHF